MDKILIVYASMTGNTEEIANLVRVGINESGSDVVIKDVVEIDATELLKYQAIVIGTYTWGEGDLPDELLDVYDVLDAFELAGRRFAIFGSGDATYDHFCGAVDHLENRIIKNGGQVVLESLKVELLPEGDEEERCKRFGFSFSEEIGRS